MIDLIDTHCHLDQYADPVAVAAAAERAGVAIIAVTGLPSHYAVGREPARALRCVRLALGLHPLLAPHAPAELTLFRQYVSTTSYIGEIGLDFSRHGRDTRKAQMQSFRVVAGILSELAAHGEHRLLTLHSRGAERAIIEHLEEFALGPAVLHWFTGSLAAAEDAVALGCYFSVNPAMVRTRSGRQLLERVPKERVLTETDGPYVRVGDRPARPEHVRDVVNALASTWGVSVLEGRQRVRQNLSALLGTLRLGRSANRAWKFCG